MTVTDMLKAARYVVDDAGRRTAVLVEIEDWERLLAWLELIADNRLAQVALEELSAGGGAASAGWVDWREGRSDWIEDATGSD